MLRSWVIRYWNSFSMTGLLLGTLFFAASLTPTLIPRNYVTQGTLSGFSAAAGYGVGFFLRLDAAGLRGLGLWRRVIVPIGQRVGAL